MTDPNAIQNLDQLHALYGEANPRSIAKETPRLTPAYRAWMERAPFFAVASVGPEGLDCSPRGDAVGRLVEVLDDRTVAFADRRGNNRIDTLRNIVRDPRIALLFLIPGINETLRINGKARVTTDPDLMRRFEMDGKPPVSAIVVEIEAVYFQCARALIRSALWDPASRAAKEDVPSAGQMTAGADEDFDAETYDSALYDRQMTSLY